MTASHETPDAQQDVTNFTMTLSDGSAKMTIAGTVSAGGDVAFGAPQGKLRYHTVDVEFVINFSRGFVLSGDAWRVLENEGAVNSFIHLLVIDVKNASVVADLASRTAEPKMVILAADTTASTTLYHADGDRESVMEEAVGANWAWDEENELQDIQVVETSDVGYLEIIHDMLEQAKVRQERIAALECDRNDLSIAKESIESALDLTATGVVDGLDPEKLSLSRGGIIRMLQKVEAELSVLDNNNNRSPSI